MDQSVSENGKDNWNNNVKVLFSEEILKQKVEELGAMVSKDYAGRIPILVAVLKGSFIFIADLCRKISIPVIFDFMAVSSYGDAMASSGVVRISKDLDYSIENRDVLIIEDIIDSGRTLNYLVKNIEARNPRSVEICALLDKDVPGKFKNKIKYKGFDIPNKFVVGYGLDFAENYRNLPFIGYIENTV
jgi:hypoxanthine phosphoribosyltransferase